MFSKSSTRMGRPISIAAGLIIALIMGASAYASKGLVQDRRVSLAQAQEMATHAQSDSGFPVVVNERVLKQLNRFIGTPEGRDFMRASLARMETYKGLVGHSLQKYGMPNEIMAVPLIESGYQNLGEREDSKSHSAGLWQFIPSTARIYGLRVDGQKDERLDPTLNTDAALRYLQANHLRFGDWQLSALAYNMGERALQSAIEAVGSRDAWTVVNKGYENDKDYLAKLMAAILIMRNPESVQ
jgi:hypothetical protein